jgi:hypothetical protein
MPGGVLERPRPSLPPLSRPFVSSRDNRLPILGMVVIVGVDAPLLVAATKPRSGGEFVRPLEGAGGECPEDVGCGRGPDSAAAEFDRFESMDEKV